jgi:hypothetical protein
MKEIIMKSVLAMLIIGTILTIGTNLHEVARNILAAIAVTFAFAYAFYNSKKASKVKNN